MAAEQPKKEIPPYAYIVRYADETWAEDSRGTKRTPHANQAYQFPEAEFDACWRLIRTTEGHGWKRWQDGTKKPIAALDFRPY